MTVGPKFPYLFFSAVLTALLVLPCLLWAADAERIARHNRSLQQLEDKLARNKQHLQALETKQEQLLEQEQAVRQTLLEALNQRHQLHRDAVRLARWPETANILSALMKSQAARPQLLDLVRRGMQQQQQSDYQALQELAEQKRQLHNNRQSLLKQRQRLVERYQRISSTRRAMLKQLTEEAPQRATELRQAYTPRKFDTMRRQQPATSGILTGLVSGTIQQAFHHRNTGGITQNGLQVITPPAAPVVAPQPLTVLYNDAFRNYGQLLIADLGGGRQLVLGGLAESYVPAGTSVNTGDVIARLPQKPNPTLYLELHDSGRVINPLELLD